MLIKAKHSLDQVTLKRKVQLYTRKGKKSLIQRKKNYEMTEKAMPK